MIIKDTVSLEREQKGLAQERAAAQVYDAIDQLKKGEIQGDLHDSFLNPQRQLGRSITAKQLEDILRRISPNFIFEQAPNPTKKRLKFQVPGEAEPRYICLYEASIMPEHSVKNGMYKWEPDLDYALGHRTLERAEVRGEPVSLQEAHDLIQNLGPQGAKAELLKKRESQGLNDPDYRPGFKKVLVNWSEAIRGWRTVLALVMLTGYVTGEDVYKAITPIHDPATVRESWAKACGSI